MPAGDLVFFTLGRGRPRAQGQTAEVSDRTEATRPLLPSSPPASNTPL